MPYEAEGKVLVVDDDRDDLLLIWLAFGDAGVNQEIIIKAESFNEGIVAINLEPVKGVVVDGLEGWWESLAEAAIRAGVPPQAIILCSGNVSVPQYKSKVREFGIGSVDKRVPGFAKEVAGIVSGWLTD